MRGENSIKVRVQFQVVLVQVVEKLVCAQYLGNAHQLVVVIVTVEERLLLEDHPCKHTTKRPHIQGVVVLLKVHEQLWTFEVTGGDTDIVLLACCYGKK